MSPTLPRAFDICARLTSRARFTSWRLLGRSYSCCYLVRVSNYSHYSYYLMRVSRYTYYLLRVSHYSYYLDCSDVDANVGVNRRRERAETRRRVRERRGREAFRAVLRD